MLKGNEFNFFLKPGRTVTSDDSKLEGHGLLFIVDGTQRLVKQGTAESLVDYLVNSDSTDVAFLQTFIFSHRLFIESSILLNMLTTRFRQQAGNPKGKGSLAKVINALKYWVENFFDDFANNEDMLETLNYLLEEFSTDSACQNLVNMLASTVTRKVVLCNYGTLLFYIDVLIYSSLGPTETSIHSHHNSSHAQDPKRKVSLGTSLSQRKLRRIAVT
jgi:hypothetical protein